ncbi:MAG: SRPBCC domain-containing protein [Gemmatimonadota bacterium]|nr:SRPBCC domain-containing protein [Gemmatimonadota bacterium]
MRLVEVVAWMAVVVGGVLGEARGAVAQEAGYGAFVFRDSVMVPGTAERAFDQFVDVNAWWDHRFSESPARFFLEPKVGSGFWELFDDAGNGVRHAEVIYVHRPSVLRMEGPLGLSGNAIQLVFTLQFTAHGDSTTVALEVHGAGELREGWPQVVQAVWHHFLAERYKPYVEGRLE